MSITVAELRVHLQDMLDQLNDFNDDDCVKTVSNTYFIDSSYYIAVGAEGYVDAENIRIVEDNDDEDED